MIVNLIRFESDTEQRTLFQCSCGDLEKMAGKLNDYHLQKGLVPFAIVVDGTLGNHKSSRDVCTRHTDSHILLSAINN